MYTNDYMYPCNPNSTRDGVYSYKLFDIIRDI